MKTSRLILPLFALLLAVSCASAPPAAPPPASGDLWPKIYDDETYLATFASAWSPDEAIGTVRNLQNSIVDFNANLPISELNVDAYGMRVRWTWTEAGAIVKSAGSIIPFDQVTSMLLEYYPTIDKNFKWGLLVYLGGGNPPVSFRTPARDAAERLGKAILVLAKARGAAMNLANTRFGAATAALTDDQARAAGIQKTGGIIISWIFKESPAEKAGFSPQDIITGIGGKPVASGNDLFSAIDAAAAAGAKSIPIAGIRRSYRTEGGKRIEVFVPVVFTLAIDQTEAQR
ncbi:PDZ domain-containing protein [bacterium]|nr:PDZ domain-containing protein [bacterium]